MTKAERFARFGELVEQGDAVQVVLMESWLDDELKCESKHRATGKHNCQHIATHLSRVIHDGDRKLVCSTVADYISHWRSVEGVRCECGSLLIDCWKVIPV